MSSPLRIASVGCGHGALNEIYENLSVEMAKRSWDAVDCVIIGGDFQTLRNSNDATCISMPDKYKTVGDFHEYYSGERVAPVLTIFCGGNHEAGNYLFELYYGGWVAPNIYYLGASNVLRLGPLRISGMSGIWKNYDFRKQHHERLPYNSEDIMSTYHIREIDVRKLLQVRTQVDVGLSHDWPRAIEKSGDCETLFRKKKHLRDDSMHGRLGSPAAREVLDRLRPAYWFSAHLHTRFALTMGHSGKQLEKAAPCCDEPAEWCYVAAKATTPVDPTPNPGDMAAWQNFGDMIRAKERADNEAYRADFEKRERARAANTATTANPVDTATWRQVIVNEDGQRSIVTVSKPATAPKVQNEDEISLGSGSSSNGSPPAEHSTGVVSKPVTTPKVQNEDEISLGSGSSSNGSPPAKHSTVVVPKPVTPPKVQNEDEISLGSSCSSTGSPPAKRSMSRTIDGACDTETGLDDVIPEALRNRLPASLGKPAPQMESPAKMGHPEAIKNQTTKFLALDKPGGRDSYLELVEVMPISDQSNTDSTRPFRLQYDKEWLAITRVFAQDLKLGDPAAKVPFNVGEAEYLKAILEAEAWVEENVVQRGKLNIPFDFARVAPVFDPSVPVTTTDAPREFPNPQTAQFCELVGIENKFALSDEECEARVARGPRPTSRPNFDPSHRRGARGRHGRGGRGGQRGRGQRFS
ncbi:hypothetical protein N7454_000156 [Penicillium verhagenii]|nr:hypothetical protein N7454_000156 [Penicillium verhagenii]